MALKTKSKKFYNKTKIRRVMFITYKLLLLYIVLHTLSKINEIVT